MPHSCNVCKQELRDPTPESHHLERSPLDGDLCLGCWIGWIEFEKFLLRAGRPARLSIFARTVMRKLLQLYDEVKLSDV